MCWPTVFLALALLLALALALQLGGDAFQAVAYLNRGGASIERNEVGDGLGPDVKLDTSQQQLAEVRKTPTRIASAEEDRKSFLSTCNSYCKC